MFNLFLRISVRYLFLTHRAVHAASSADHDAAERFPADRTRLAVMSVNLQKRRVAIVLSLCLQILLRRNLVLFDKKGQPFRNNRSEAVPFLCCQCVGRPCQMDVSGKQNFIRIDIANSSYNTLIQQALLDDFLSFSQS